MMSPWASIILFIFDYDWKCLSQKLKHLKNPIVLKAVQGLFLYLPGMIGGKVDVKLGKIVFLPPHAHCPSLLSDPGLWVSGGP